MSRMVDFFFCDDIDSKKDYTSFSIGEVWLYFYKEILIGVRDLRSNFFVALAVDDSVKVKQDGYTHRHEITSKTIERLVSGDLKEVYPNARTWKTSNKADPEVRLLQAEDLASLAFEWASSSISQQIDRALNVSRR